MPVAEVGRVVPSSDGGCGGRRRRGGFAADAAGARPGAGIFCPWTSCALLPAISVAREHSTFSDAAADLSRAVRRRYRLRVRLLSAVRQCPGRVCRLSASARLRRSGPSLAASTPCYQGSICTTMDAPPAVRQSTRLGRVHDEVLYDAWQRHSSVCLDPKFCAVTVRKNVTSYSLAR